MTVAIDGASEFVGVLEQIKHQWDNMAEVFDKYGDEAEGMAQASFSGKAGPDGDRWPAAASPKPWPLLQRTGDLQGAIVAGADPKKPNAFSIRVKSSAWYWYLQQYGTSRTGGSRRGRARFFRKGRGGAGFVQGDRAQWDSGRGWFRRVGPARAFIPVEPRSSAERRMYGGNAGKFWQDLNASIAAWLARPGGDLR